MKRIKQSPILIALLMGALLIALLLLFKGVLKPLNQPMVSSVLQGLLLIGAFTFINKRFLGVEWHLVSNRVPMRAQLIALTPLFFYILFANLSFLLDLKQEYILPALVFSIVAGVVEEYICRGIVLGYLTKHSQGQSNRIWLGVFLSSFIFGIAHAPNFLVQPLEFTVFQIITASMIGLFYGALYLRTQSLVWVIFSHFLQDFAAIGSQGVASVVNQEVPWHALPLFVIVFGTITFVLLRPKKMEEVIAQHNFV
ncbi:CPBP family intramembrane glutamic endopeptidase [Streptococcus cameli]